MLSRLGGRLNSRPDGRWGGHRGSAGVTLAHSLLLFTVVFSFFDGVKHILVEVIELLLLARLVAALHEILSGRHVC